MQRTSGIGSPVTLRDEVEKAMAGSGSSGSTDSGVTARVFATLLTWLNDKTTQVFVVMTANNVHALPPELLRKGRLDELFFVDLPVPSIRQDIFRIHLAKRGMDVDSFDLSAVADITSGFSGSEIEQVVIAGMYTAFDDGQRALATSDLIREAHATVPLSKTMKANIEDMRAWAKTRARMADEEVEEIPDGEENFGRFNN